MIFSIDDAARRNRVALIEGNEGLSHTYQELAERVLRCRNSLRAMQKSLLFLFCKNDLRSVVFYLAALEAGHAVALLNDQLDAQLRANLISLYKPEWVVSSVAVDSETYETPDADGLWRRRQPDLSPLHSDLGVLLSTSGSTGSPKFVRLTRSNVEANAASIATALEINDLDVPIAHLPVHYSYGLSVLNSHLLVGASTLLLNAGLVTPIFWDAIRKFQVNSFSGVPYTYQTLRRLDLEKVNAPTLRKMTQAGGKLDSANISYFHERMTERQGGFWVMYGQTEATARISILSSSETVRKLGSAGRAIPGGVLNVVNDSGEVVTAADVEGEVVYTGPNVMLGYANERADLSKGDELNGRLHTGDRGRLDAEGFLYILGRAKRDAKVFGLRINLDELESFVKAHGPAAAVAGPNRVIVFCEFGTADSHREVCNALSAKLQIHSSAFEFRKIERLPTKDTGKINYEDLLAQA